MFFNFLFNLFKNPTWLLKLIILMFGKFFGTTIEMISFKL